MSLIENASRRFPDSIGVHPVCFRCGAQHDDGLEVYAAPVGGNDIVAAAWPTKHEWADARGNVPACFIWTALDYPGHSRITQQESAPGCSDAYALDLSSP